MIIRYVALLALILLTIFCVNVKSSHAQTKKPVTLEDAKSRILVEQHDRDAKDVSTAELLSRLILEIGGQRMTPEAHRETVEFVKKLGTGYGVWDRDGYKWQLGMFALAAAEQNARIKALERDNKELLDRLNKLENQLKSTPASK